MATPHNSAKPGDFSPIVLMPGDPKRSQHIAEKYLTNVTLINNVRNVEGYTGLYDGDTPVSVMASGMGMPSIAIYVEELYREYSVEAIIRVGSAGALTPRLLPRDLIIAQGACTNSNFMHQYQLPGTFAPLCDFELLEIAVQAAREYGAPFEVGNVLSTDTFYDAFQPGPKWARMGVLGVDMESAALYAVAARHGKKALTINAISDYLPGIERPQEADDLSAAERASTLDDVIEVALKTAARFHCRDR